MSKELFITSTPHETKLAIVEDDQLVEVYFERENEYTLAGSIYKGKVTRVLPGMQSAFVNIGLERDAFLYVTDFLEEVEDGEDFEPVVSKPRAEAPGTPEGRFGRRRQPATAKLESTVPQESVSEDVVEPVVAAESNSEEAATEAVTPERGTRRWRGRRGRRRGRAQANQLGTEAAPTVAGLEAGDESEKFTSSDSLTGSGAVEESGVLAESYAAEDSFNEFVAEAEATAAPIPEKPAAEAHGVATKSAREPRPEFKPMILPGESLAKFGRPVEKPKTQSDTEVASGSRLQPRIRPSTEVAVSSGVTSAGVLPGESLAKYRNRTPLEVDVTETAKTQSEADAAGRVISAGEAVANIPKVVVSRVEPVTEIENEGEAEAEALPSVLSAGGAVETVEEEFEEVEEKVLEESAPAQEPAKETSPIAAGKFGFNPGAGLIEEEEIEGDEHELGEFTERLDDSVFEELEEETLDVADQKEAEVIAAGEGLAAALAQSRVEARSEGFLADEISAVEEAYAEAGEAGEDEDIEEFEMEGSDLEESEDEDGDLLAGGDEAEEITDPDHPDYVGSAEQRAPAGTAGFERKTARSRFEPRRGGRKGGRGMRRGGPRRNIPSGPMPQITDLLKEGQEILVQIAKEPMAKKGARITSHIALPGRFLVFMPTVAHTGVSRKIASEEERQRLKRILLSEKGQSSGGFIVRTAASGASEEDLRADIRFLINLWNEIKTRSESGKAPALIYHDLNLVERILRDQVTATFSHIWVDSEQEYERILRFASRFQPSLIKRVKLYTKETPLFEQFAVQEEINKALKSKVWLKSGGYIVINQTEALVAIDINTGKYVGKTGRLEDTIVKTNMDAIKEIVRQIRLRDLGGIIIIDFIDMDERKNRQKVMQALEEALRSDRSPSKVLQFNDFGLVAITRKRVKQSLERTLGTQCTYCAGTGFIKSVATVCNEIYVEMRKIARHIEGRDVMLRVNPEVAKTLKANASKWLVEMEELLGKTVIVKSDPSLHQEQFDIN